MLIFQAVQSLWREERIKRLHRTDFRRLKCVEYRSSGGRNNLNVDLTVGIATETAGQDWLEPPWHSQLLRRDGVDKRIERSPLQCARDRARSRRVSVHRIGEIDTAQ